MDYTKYEEARIIGARALQISMGAPFLVKLTDEDLQKMAYSPVEIAKLEFSKGIIPIAVKRKMPERRKDSDVPPVSSSGEYTEEPEEDV